MSTLRKLGVILCLIGFFVVCALALTSTADRPFAGLQGIQDSIQDDALEVLAGTGASITAEGRNLEIDLSEARFDAFDRDAVRAELANIEGVRNVELIGEPTVRVPIDQAPAPVATETPAAEPTTEPSDDPTDEPATEEPAPQATAAPAPQATEEPAAPTLAELVGTLDLSGVEFEPGSAELTADDQATLDTIASQLQGQTGAIEVQVHTDNVGDPDVNLLLSQDRAISVVGYLMSKGVDADLLTPKGFGASQPIADNSTEQGRAANRRVAFVVEGN